MTLAVRTAEIPASPLARWDARWKLAGIVTAIVASALLQTPTVLGIALAGVLALCLTGRIPLPILIGRCGLLLLGVLPLIVILPFTQGWEIAAAIALRVVVIGLLGLLLVRTEPLSQLLTAANRIGVPGPFVQVALLSYRYLFLFAAEVRRTRVALRTRGFLPRTSLHTYRTFGSVLGSLLVRSGTRAERVSEAMRARGFDGAFHCLTPFQTRWWDVAAFFGIIAGAGALLAADRLIPWVSQG